MSRVFRDETLNSTLLRDGVVVVDLLDACAIDRLIAIYRDEVGSLPDHAFFTTMMSESAVCRQRVDRAVREAFAAKLLPLFADYRLAVGSFLIKASGPAGTVHLHQDWSFLDESLATSVGLWCPLVDVDETNGCLCFIKGSHVLNREPRGWTAHFPYPNLVPELMRDHLTSIPAKAGQCFIFVHSMMHASMPNETANPRVAAACIAVPQEIPLLYLHSDDVAHPHHYRVFEVPDDYFIAQPYRSVPECGRDLGMIERQSAPLTIKSFEQLSTARLAATAAPRQRQQSERGKQDEFLV
jgi:hypothetical protein